MIGKSRVICMLALCATLGCAGPRQMRPGAANALIAVGALVTTIGILTSAGCPDLSSNGTGCGEGPSDPNLAAGLPITAVGVGMVTAGVVGRAQAPGPSMAKSGKPKSTSRWQPTPRPAQPDPFVAPLTPL